jgi:hypothetical protein
MSDDAKPPEAGETGSTIYGIEHGENKNLSYLHQQELTLRVSECSDLDSFIIGWLSSAVSEAEFREAVNAGVGAILARRK